MAEKMLHRCSNRHHTTSCKPIYALQHGVIQMHTMQCSVSFNGSEKALSLVNAILTALLSVILLMTVQALDVLLLSRIATRKLVAGPCVRFRRTLCCSSAASKAHRQCYTCWCNIGHC
jgi:hypothetical protein